VNPTSRYLCFMATRRRFARTLGLAATMFKVFSGLYIALPPHDDIHRPLPNLTVQSVYISPHTTHLTYPSRTSKGLHPYNSRQHPPPVKLSTASRLLSNPHVLTITPKDIINVPSKKEQCVTSTNQTISAIAIITILTPAIASTTRSCTRASIGMLSGMPTDIAIMSSTTSDQCPESA
jgi:hypothetical protein